MTASQSTMKTEDAVAAEIAANLALLTDDQLDHLEALIAAERAGRADADDAAVEAMTGDEAERFVAAEAAADPALAPA